MRGCVIYDIIDYLPGAVRDGAAPETVEDSMRGLRISLAGLFVIVLVALSGSGGCNSGDVCDINFNEFQNGTSLETQDSEWQCENGGVIVFTIAFFSDGFGVRSDAGDFEWEQTKCKEVELETLALEQATLDRIEGGVREVAGVTVGTLSFRQTSDELGDLTVACNLVVF